MAHHTIPKTQRDTLGEQFVLLVAVNKHNGKSNCSGFLPASVSSTR